MKKLYVVAYGKDCDGLPGRQCLKFDTELDALEAVREMSEYSDGLIHKAVDAIEAQEYCEDHNIPWEEPMQKVKVQTTRNYSLRLEEEEIVRALREYYDIPDDADAGFDPSYMGCHHTFVARWERKEQQTDLTDESMMPDK